MSAFEFVFSRGLTAQGELLASAKDTSSKAPPHVFLSLTVFSITPGSVSTAGRGSSSDSALVGTQKAGNMAR